jgi:hypothetical protein
MFHELGPLPCSESDLSSGSINSVKCSGRIPGTGDGLTARLLSTEGITVQKNTGIHQCLDRDSNP